MNLPFMSQGGMANQYQDPGFLAQMTGQTHQQQLGILGGGAGGGSMLGNPIAKAALGGITAMPVKNLMGR